MKPITPAKRRLVVALAVAVKNYARLQKEADEWLDAVDRYRTYGYCKNKADRAREKAANAIFYASLDFSRNYNVIRIFRRAGLRFWAARARCANSERLFRRAAIKIAQRGGLWRNDEFSKILSEHWT